MDITKEQVEKWCKENNHATIDLKKSHISADVVLEIAMKATGVDSISKTDQKHEYSFSRYLAISYLDNYYATGVISKMLKMHHSAISHARNMWLLDERTELKYFKEWQKNAILYFREKIKHAKRLYDDRLNKGSEPS